MTRSVLTSLSDVLGLPAEPSVIEIVEAVHRIPYGSTRARDSLAPIREGCGTCSTKHYLLAAALAEHDPTLAPRLIHRVYRLERDAAAEMFGETVAASVPAEGLTDVHTYLVVSRADRPVRIDVTYPDSAAWDGRSDMPLRCGEGRDVPAGRDPDATKIELKARHCDPRVREPFIAALAEREPDRT